MGAFALTILFFSTFCDIKQPAPITLLSLISTPCRIVTFAPMKTFRPIMIGLHV